MTQRVRGTGRKFGAKTAIAIHTDAFESARLGSHTSFGREFRPDSQKKHPLRINTFCLSFHHQPERVPHSYIATKLTKPPKIEPHGHIAT